MPRLRIRRVIGAVKRRNDNMTTDPKSEAALPLHRFGFGPVRDQIVAIADDPRGAVLADLERPVAGRVAAANLPSSAEASRQFFGFPAERQAAQKLAERAKKAAGAIAMAATEPNDAQAAETAPPSNGN